MSTARAATVEAIERDGVVAVVRLRDASTMDHVVGALVEGGVRAIEITMTVPGAVDLIARLSRTAPAGCLVGAGTVLDVETAHQVIAAGARFVVSPILRPDVIAAGHAQDVAVMPGCFSPTEIQTAWQAGADIVKVFPATALGPGYFTDIRGPLPHVKLMPTGGVTLDNAGAWIRAGAVAVGLGGALVDPAAVASGTFATLTANARRVIAGVAAARNAALSSATHP